MVQPRPRDPRRGRWRLVWGESMRNMVASTAAVAALLCAVAPAVAGNPGGKWLTKDGTATVNIAPCGEALCGTIVALKEPNDPKTGKPKVDSENPDTAKRG